MSTKENFQEQVDVDILVVEVPQHEIILYDDDFHTFDYVIDSLIDVCEHTLIQAEQCTMLVHYKGKCGVKSGEYKELKEKCSKLLELGLTAEIV